MRVIEYQADNAFDRRFKSGLILSLVIHLIFVYVITKSSAPQHVTENLLEVSIVPDMVKQEDPAPQEVTQMVEPPQSEEAPKDAEIETNLLSDKNFVAEKEQVKRGDRPDAGPSIAKASKPIPETKPQTQAPQEKAENSSPPHKLNLKLDEGTLMEKFASNKPQKSNSPDRASSYQAFSRPAGSGAAFIGTSGTSDFLPNLPDGDITLLNAKADKFAVFVRRVASLVFSHMRSTGWEKLSASDLARIEDYSTVHAVLDKEGNLIRVSLESPSGSKRFDETLNLAVKSGAHDPNPPKDALAEDGFYHFIFKSKSWSMLAHAPKTGAPFERRWLLLSTGLL